MTGKTNKQHYVYWLSCQFQVSARLCSMIRVPLSSFKIVKQGTLGQPEEVPSDNAHLDSYFVDSVATKFVLSRVRIQKTVTETELSPERADFTLYSVLYLMYLLCSSSSRLDFGLQQAGLQPYRVDISMFSLR